MSVLTAMFEQLISPEQKRVVATVLKKGGVATIRNNDDMLLEVEKASSKASPSAEGHQVLSSWAKPSDAKVDADDLRADILEDPDAAVEKNKAYIHPQIRRAETPDHRRTELKSVIKREGDRVIEEMKSGPHQRIRAIVYVFPPFIKARNYQSIPSPDNPQYLGRNGRYDGLNETLDID
jgi:hypothetical protein